MKLHHLSTCTLFVTGISFFNSALAADDCHRVNLRKRIDIEKCTEAPVTVTTFDCKTRKVIEETEVVAQLDCTSGTLRMSTPFNGKIFYSELEATPQSSAANYRVIKTSYTPPAPPVPETLPVTIKLSGFVWMEYERSALFGYNGGSALTNFDSSVGNQQDFSSLLSNIQLDIAKDRTTFTSIFEVGEMIGGEAVTGGFQGGRQRALEIRNMFLAHEFNSNWALRAGLINMASDPNSFILSDHHSTIWLDYKSENLNGSLWTAKAKEVKPGSTANNTPVTPTLPAQTNPIYPDTYAGFLVTPAISDMTKLTGFAVYRRTKESFVDDAATSQLGSSEYYWEGATVDHRLSDTYSLQWTGILNQGKFKADEGGASDSLNAYLMDFEFDISYKEIGWDFVIEGLTTSGGSETPIIGKRKAFSSPDPGCAYLLTIATSDGADDFAGSLKESVIGNLSQNEGIQLGMLKANKTISDKLSAFVRYGYLRSSAKNLTTNSQEMGQEYDFSLTYELSQGTQLFMDYGYFKPGSFFAKTEPAQLFTTRLKFTF